MRRCFDITSGVSVDNIKTFITDLDLNECAQQSRWRSDATCQNVVGSYTCACKIGYVGNGIVCSGKIMKKTDSMAITS